MRLRQIRPYHLRLPWLPGGISAITLWPCILYRGDAINDPCLRAHEEFHWQQARRCWVLPWYAAYLLLLPFYRGQSREHPLEQMAYLAQARCYARGGEAG